jgi:hypothetical protein
MVKHRILLSRLPEIELWNLKEDKDSQVEIGKEVRLQTRTVLLKKAKKARQIQGTKFRALPNEIEKELFKSGIK